MNRQQTGFTLLELMYTLAVALLVVGIGAPSFVETLRSSRMNATTNGMLGALYLARSEAVKQRARVSVCRSTVGENADCAADGTGFLVFLNQDDDDDFDDFRGDVVIRADEWIRPGIDVVYDGLPQYFTYVASGFPRAVGGGPLTGNLVFCDERGDAVARVLTISATGRPQILSHEDVAGVPSCDS
jgi:type IV fimbrial biogenesis protein FimT